MQVLDYPYHDILINPVSENRFSIVDSARTCYASDSTNEESDKKLLELLAAKDESPLEQSRVKIRFTCDRGVSHQLIRHRHCSYNQQSTRYCDYSRDKFDGITVIKPIDIVKDSMEYYIWLEHCTKAEKEYKLLLELGQKPQEARSILPTCLATVVDMYTNLRELRSILWLRTARNAQPEMRYMMHGVLIDMYMDYPEIFGRLFAERNPQIIDDFSKKGN